LPRTFTANVETRPAGRGELALRLLRELGYPGAQIGLQLVRALVMGHDAKHFLQRSDLVVDILGRPESLLCLEVLGW